MGKDLTKEIKKGGDLFSKAEKLLDNLGENDIGKFKDELTQLKKKIDLIIESQIKIMERLDKIAKEIFKDVD